MLVADQPLHGVYQYQLPEMPNRNLSVQLHHLQQLHHLHVRLRRVLLSHHLPVLCGRLLQNCQRRQRILPDLHTRLCYLRIGY